MPHKKNHIWQPVKGLPGVSKCQRCGVVRYKSPLKAKLFRNNIEDKSKFRYNCFVLSKD